ncbi:hypothetical protein V8F06_002784 [Rhypophila decipiens]
MVRLSSSILSLTAALASTVVVDAATCANYGGSDMQYFMASSEYLHWNLREKLCNTNTCTNLQVCELKAYSSHGAAKLYSKDVQYRRTDCWGATANIITQCSRNWWKTGWWQWGDQFYQLYSSPSSDLKKRDANATAPDSTWTDEETGVTYEVRGWNLTEDAQHEQPPLPAAEAIL